MEIEHKLRAYATESRLEPRLRARAAEMLSAWTVSGVIPAPSAVRELDRAVDRLTPSVCKKIHRDGSCGWLRSYGASYGLPVPPVGEPAMCLFRDRMRECAGYQRSD